MSRSAEEPEIHELSITLMAVESLTSLVAFLDPVTLTTWHKSGGPSSRNVAARDFALARDDFDPVRNPSKLTQCFRPRSQRFADIELEKEHELNGTFASAEHRGTRTYLNKLGNVLEQIGHGKSVWLCFVYDRLKACPFLTRIEALP